MKLMKAQAWPEILHKSKVQKASCCVSKGMIRINVLKVDIKCLEFLKTESETGSQLLQLVHVFLKPA